MQEPEPGDLLGRRWGDASSMPLLRVTLAVDSSDPPVHLCISLLPQHVQPAAGTVAEEVRTEGAVWKGPSTTS
jgi:hypothetical protein